MPIVLVSGIVIFRILDGKIAEIWHEESFIEALRAWPEAPHVFELGRRCGQTLNYFWTWS